MKKIMYFLLCCIIFAGCSNYSTEDYESAIRKEPIPLRLSNGTYMPVEFKFSSKRRSDEEILPADLNENGVVVLENKAEAYEMAVTLLQIKNPAFLKKELEYGITYDEDLGVYKIIFTPKNAARGESVTYVIKNTGKVLSVE